MAEIVMPRLSDTMEEGTVLRWLKRDGEHVRRGEELVEIETDKAAMVYESDQEGVLRILAQEGDTLAVGATIANVGETTEDNGASSAQTPPTEAHAGTAEAPGELMQATTAEHRAAEPTLAGEQAIAEQEPANLGTPAASASGSAEELSDRPASRQAGGAGDTERVKASPLARRIASENGVDLHTLAGSGPGGRIVKADVEAADQSAGVGVGATSVAAPGAQAEGAPEQGLAATGAAGGAPATHADGAPVPPTAPATLAERIATAKGETTVVELTRIQQTIARRMAESKATIPDFALQMEIDMEQCLTLRSELKRLSPAAAPTYNDMVVKACALALREYPRANGSYRDGKLQLHSRVNVGVAVAVGAETSAQGAPATGGVARTSSGEEGMAASAEASMADALVVPTVFDADLKSLGEIARETRALAERVRAGTITPPELGGGTFTVSNLGMYGVRSFTAIINPPQAGILSVGSLESRAVGRDGKLVARHTMSVTLACDHRILYGANAARFLARVRELLEEPAALAL